MQKHTKLGQLLVKTGTVQEWQFLAAMGARRPGQKLGDVMISKGFLTEDQLLDALSLQLEVPRIELAGMSIDPDAVKEMPGHVARRFTVFPVAIKPAANDLDVATLVVAMTDPSDMRVIEALRFLLDVEIEPVLAGRKEIVRAIEKTYGPDDPGSADKLPIPFPRSTSGRFAGGAARMSFVA